MLEYITKQKVQSIIQYRHLQSKQLMDQIFNDPIISNFFQTIQQKDKKTTLKQLVLLGINDVSSKIHNTCGRCCCSNLVSTKAKVVGQTAPGCANTFQCACQCTYVPNIARVYQTGGKWNGDMGLQIQRMKNRINQLQSHINSCGFNKQPVHSVEDINGVHAHTQDRRELKEPELDSQGLRKQFRHHLDDSQVRRALINPYAKFSPPKEKKKQKRQQLDRKHQIQKQRDEQELRKIRNKNQGGTVGTAGLPVNSQEYDEEQNDFLREKINEKSKSKSKEKEDKINSYGTSHRFKNVEESSRPQNTGHRNALGQLVEEENVHTINTVNSSKKIQSQNRSHQNPKKSSVVVNNATSKIKSLIERDKNRSRNNKGTAFMKKSGSKNAVQQKYCQFQYSDQQYSQEEQSSFNNYRRSKQISNQKQNDGPCPVHDSLGKSSSNLSEHQKQQHVKSVHQSRLFKTKQFKSTYKQTRKKMKESMQEQEQEQEQAHEQQKEDEEYQQEEDPHTDNINERDDQNGNQSDAISQSSSFSKFSMSSRRQRQTGKISGLRKF